MCEITEDLFFNDPYQIHERNNYPEALENDVAALRNDHQLKIAVASPEAPLLLPGRSAAARRYSQRLDFLSPRGA